MTTPKFITYEQGEAALNWLGLTDALAEGHRLPKAEIEDIFLYRGDDTLLSRAAWIDGLGSLVKTATIFPGNAPERPAVNGSVTLYSDTTGEAEAFVDFHLVTKWKTAGDSLLAARRLARPESRKILILGAGAVSASLIEAYSAGFPGAEFTLWNRTAGRAAQLAEETGARVAQDLEAAVGEADIIATATMSTEPVLKGAWLQPGQHVDLIGAYRPDMREADGEVLKRARLFVDSRDTTVGHIGELKDPIARGVISEADIVADYYELDAFRRESDEEITVTKNGGGAHLDLMTARHILSRVGA
ncbi:ornithine cyclodeaminase family protein [Vannielia litorea]|uniref:ornithine cyclodeaminase family protein n=1 Tax=Vannielia litorea TaxID=1217970 RepID=UPI001C93F71B|nr:NAD(P)-binding domain-containing protein [Vannielia litorea]MBY6049982.1 NAD(P)-binding domain-containing protein [Vannielia litorea]MBY6077396.1 NAD(P)-binding domain-containing protein [Vannielia litorea]